MGNKYFKYILLAPALLIMAIITIFPLIRSLWISFHEWKLTESLKMGAFIGFDNYVKAFSDPNFWSSAWVTLVFTVAAVLVTISCAIMVALLLSKEKTYISYLRAILIIPFALSPALVGYSWRFMLNPDYGVFSAIVGFFFPPLADVVWLGNTVTAMIALISVVVWIWLPFMSLMFISGIMGLPKEVYEAAKMDGANSIQTFFRITLPMIQPIVLIATILMTMFSLKQFDPIVTLTSGGPGNSTEVLNFLVYTQSFRYFDMGYGAALGYILAIITIGFVLVYMRKLVKGDEWN
ncbi:MULTISPECIES: sugar ABC transporter permease [unclassified Oceanobacillus]|uniref:carbohydrate ABC transporter permease n=1 Tax=unclassified Oceanobacillus TaxID=2630292 RepID=UPI001BEB92D1|nr:MULTISPECIES: sugar ABC transporter permease [unclassified Oceanobacillus]MBT2600506.1 sugar ABC transporter permease [Oceanobacillus sp. ISL-74]MBT2650664.1 sugar ABC transporter permease [Oceanobacillus sp. ISL-73]